MLNQENTSDPEEINKIFENLNWWMEQTYNPETNEIQSTGEAQSAIKSQLLQLEKMHIKYKLENGKYSRAEE